MKYEILLADDDDSIRLVLSKTLTRAGHTVKATDNAQTLAKWASSGIGDIILTDVMMGGSEVFETLPEIVQDRPDIPIIIISANNTVNTALKSGQHKVFEYVPKPFDLEEVTQAVARAGKSVNPSKKKVKPSNLKLPMIGRSSAMQPVYRAVSRFASGDLPVLIQGEVGTGKDLVARLLHDGGHRSNRPFLRTNEFSNTSLTLQKVNGGDLYIDEIAHLNFDQQEALLSFLTESEYIPAFDRPRVISSTRKNLRALVDDGVFRDDLLFRINVAEIRVPALSDRDQDVLELAESFLALQSGSGASRRFSSEALDVLARHNWPGNVRELENMVRRLSLLYSDDVITADMVLEEFNKELGGKLGDRQVGKFEDLLELACARLFNLSSNELDCETPYQEAISWIEKPLLLEALKRTGGNRVKAAELLGIHRNTLRTRIKSLKIS